MSRMSPSFGGDVVERLDAERHAHAPLGAELVDEERVLRALRVLEQERRPAGLDDAVGDLGDLEVGVGLGGDAPQLALALEERDPLAEVSRRRAKARSVYGRERDDSAQSLPRLSPDWSDVPRASARSWRLRARQVTGRRGA